MTDVIGNIIGAVLTVVMAVTLTYGVWRFGLAGLFDAQVRLMRAVGHTLIHGRPAPKQLRRADVLDDLWSAHLDRIAADVDGVTIETLIRTAELRAEDGPVPQPKPLEPSGPAWTVQESPTHTIYDNGTTYTAVPRDVREANRQAFVAEMRTPLRGRYANCDHPDADVEEVHGHGSTRPRRRLVVRCEVCDHTVDRACEHMAPSVLTPITDPDTGDHLGNTPVCPACFEHVNGHPPPPPFQPDYELIAGLGGLRPSAKPSTH